jgi:hypothetical protein
MAILSDDFKEKAKGVVDTVVDVSVEAYKVAEEKAKAIAKWTKLNAEIVHEKATIRRLHSEIGAKYYEIRKDNPDDELREKCHAVTEAYNQIAAKKKELEDMKNSGEVGEDDIGGCDCGCEGESESEGEDNHE